MNSNSTDFRTAVPRALAPAAASLLALCLGACDLGTQIPSCEEVATVIDLDDELPGGLSPARVLELIEGQRTQTFTYAETSADAVRVEVEPGGGATELSLELIHGGGELRWIDAEEAPLTGTGPVAAIAIECPDRLEIDAELGFATADGVFAELFDVVVRVELDSFTGELGVAQITRRFEPEALLGALEVLSVSPANPDRVDWDLQVRYPLSEAALEQGQDIGEPSGHVGGGAQYVDGDVVGYGAFNLGTFGAWSLGL